MEGSTDGPVDDDVREMFRILWRRKFWIAGPVVVIMAATMAILPTLEPNYSAEAFVQIDPRVKNIIDIESVVSGLGTDVPSILGEVQIIQSRSLARATIEIGGFRQHPELIQIADPDTRLADGFIDNSEIPSINGTPLPTVADDDGSTLRGLALDDKLPSPEISRVASVSPTNLVSDRPSLGADIPVASVNRFLSKLDVAPVSRSNVVSIKFVSHDPQLAADAVNYLSDLYIEAQLASKYSATDRAASAINERLVGLESAVETSEQAIEEFRGNMGLIDGVQAPLLTEQVSRVNGELAIARSALAESRARLSEIDNNANVSDSQHIAEVLQSPVIQALRDRQAALSARYSEASSDYGPRHPTMLSILAEVEELDGEVQAEVNRLVRNIAAEVRIGGARVASLESQLTALETKAIDASRAGVRVRTLERDAEANRNLYQTFLGRYKETTIQDGLLQADARVVSYADVPSRPIQPDKKLLSSLALVASGLLGLALALIVERLDNIGLRSAEQVERAFGLPVIGFIPMLKGLRGRTHPSAFQKEHPHSAFAESIRGLQTSLMLAQQRTPVTMVVTSSIPAEGKSVLSLTLARAMATSNKKVVLLDCDLRRPSIHRALRSSNGVGVSDFLSAEDPMELKSIIAADRESSASVIFAGTIEPNSAELFRSDRMKQMLRTLRAEYDYIILDSPPVLPVSDSRILSTLCDLTVFVVRWQTTRKELVGNAIKQLREAGGTIAGTVISQVNLRQHAMYGYGDAGDYYGKYKRYYAE